MTEAQKIIMLQQMGETDSDDVLSAYLELARQKILNRMYPFMEDFEGMEVPDKYTAIQLKIANYMLGKRGAEGQIQHIENGIHRNYGSGDIPNDMLAEIVPYCQAIR